MKTYHSDVRCGAKIGSWAAAFAVAALVLCWMSAALALDIPVTASDGTPMGTISVGVSADGTGVVGGFTSTVGDPPSLAAAAAANGEDHFNWYQRVVRDNDPPNGADGTPLTPPYDDPPSGGYEDQWADGLPWYWDEGDDPDPAPEGFEDGYNLDDNTTDTDGVGGADKLDFEDFPWGPEGTSLEFNTWLVSLNADGSLHSYHGGFAWTWDRPGPPPDGGDGDGRNIFPVPLVGQMIFVHGELPPVVGDATGDGTVDAADAAILANNWQQTVVGGCSVGDFDLNGFVDDVDATIMAINWSPPPPPPHPVPEPSTLAGLVGLCLAGLLASARRRLRGV